MPQPLHPHVRTVLVAEEVMVHTCHSGAYNVGTHLQPVFKEGSAVCNLVLQLIVKFPDQLQHELLQDELRWNAVHQQLIQLAPHCKQLLWRLL